MNLKRVIFVGEPSHHEFCDAVSWLREYCDLTVCASLAAASRLLSCSQDPPTAVVLGQIRPGVFPQGEIQRLRSKAPTTMLIALMGAWCEGELRTGEPLRAVTRVYWHRFIPQIGPSLQRAAAPQAASVYQAERGLVMVHSTSRDSYEALSDACNVSGYSTVWVPQTRSVLATRAVYGIWDCRGAVLNDREELAEFACQLQPAPVIAVLGFPRGDDCEVALAAGAMSVLSKPYEQSELWSLLANSAGLQQGAA